MTFGRDAVVETELRHAGEQATVAKQGRDPAEIRKTWMGVVSLAPTTAQAERAIERYPMWPGDVAIVGAPSEVVSQLQQYTALGVDLFIVGFADEPALAGLELFIEEVLPYFEG